MKKLLILILIGLLLALSIFVVVKGVNIGNLEILGITKIQERSSELDEKIQEASKLAEKDYKQALSNVEDSTKKLQQQRKEYEDMTTISSEDDVQSANQIEKYEIETLWVKLGNHATSEGAVMKMEITKGSNTTQDTYNLKFTVTGSYISITDFISDIENDSTLGFKIEEFSMKPGSSTSDLQATFVCKDIAIKDISETSSTQTVTDSSATENTTGNTTTNSTTNTTTNTTDANNTTNTTNTTNSTAQ